MGCFEKMLTTFIHYNCAHFHRNVLSEKEQRKHFTPLEYVTREPSPAAAFPFLVVLIFVLFGLRSMWMFLHNSHASSFHCNENKKRGAVNSSTLDLEQKHINNLPWNNTTTNYYYDDAAIRVHGRYFTENITQDRRLLVELVFVSLEMSLRTSTMERQATSVCFCFEKTTEIMDPNPHAEHCYAGSGTLNHFSKHHKSVVKSLLPWQKAPSLIDSTSDSRVQDWERAAASWHDTYRVRAGLTKHRLEHSLMTLKDFFSISQA